MAHWVAFALASLSGLHAWAQASVAEDIVVGGEVALRIRAPTPKYTVRERALIVTRRLVEVASHEDTNQPEVRIVRHQHTPAIYVGRTLLVTVHHNDAAANGTDVDALASLWARNLRRLLPRMTPESKLPGFDPRSLPAI